MKEEMLQEESVNQQLPRNESVYYFVYTAIFHKFNMEEAHKILEICNSKEFQVQKRSGIDEGIEPFLNISEPFLLVTYPEITTTIELSTVSNNSSVKRITLSRSIYFLGSGVLSYSIKLVCKESLKFEEVVSIIRSDKDCLKLSYKSYEEGKPIILFDFFKNDVEVVLLNLCKGGLECEWLCVGKAFGQNGLEKKPRLEPFLVGEHFQLPYVTTCINLPDYRDKDIETIVGRLSCGFGSILRAKDGHFVNKKFMDLYLSRKANISMDSRVFLTLYPRTCLFVYGGEKKHPGEETIIGIVEIVELLRMIWHGLLVANILLDRNIHGFRRQYERYEAELSNSTKTDSAGLTKILSDIAGLRINLAEMLEDPIAYRRDSSHLSELYDSGIKRFRIGELRTMVLAKLEQVDRIYDNIRELRRRNDIESMEAEWEKVLKLRRVEKSNQNE